MTRQVHLRLRVWLFSRLGWGSLSRMMGCAAQAWAFLQGARDSRQVSESRTKYLNKDGNKLHFSRPDKFMIFSICVLSVSG